MFSNIHKIDPRGNCVSKWVVAKTLMLMLISFILNSCYLSKVFGMKKKKKKLWYGNKRRDLQKYIYKSTRITNKHLNLYILGKLRPFQILEFANFLNYFLSHSSYTTSSKTDLQKFPKFFFSIPHFFKILEKAYSLELKTIKFITLSPNQNAILLWH